MVMAIAHPTRPVASAHEFVTDADFVQLSRLVIEHSYRADNGLADTLHELYIDDGELDLGAGSTIRGRRALREWGRELVEHAPWRATRHVASNMRFLSDGPDVAHGVPVLTVFMDPDGSQPSVPRNVGQDHDRFVRTAQGWRLVSRRWVNLFTRGDLVPIP
jgi:hypothetical protein